MVVVCFVSGKLPRLVVAVRRFAILQGLVTFGVETGVGLRVATRVDGLCRNVIISQGTVLFSIFFDDCLFLTIYVSPILAIYLQALPGYLGVF